MGVEENKVKLVVLSDFNSEIFSRLLENDSRTPQVESIRIPFGQIISAISEKDGNHWEKHPEFGFTWTKPESVIPSFSKLLQGDDVSLPHILNEVDQFSDRLLHLSNRLQFLFVSSWVVAPFQRSSAFSDLNWDLGLGHCLLEMNYRLVKNLRGKNGIHLFDSERWVSKLGSAAFSSKMWYLAKVPYTNAFQKAVVEDIKSTLQTLRGASRKIILLDLDDTLWGGIVGDQGYENLALGGHDPIGEAFADFQKSLLTLRKKGILLGIVSKNDEQIALEAIEKNSEMALVKNDFVGWRINWKDKAQNIIDLAAELNLGLQSVVFIDDNPVERDRVSHELPEVLVPQWPKDKMLYVEALAKLSCFDFAQQTKEDGLRTEMYISDRKRESEKRSVGTIDEWLKSIETKVEVQEVSEINLKRTLQLMNKTNQMNLATRRMTEPTFLAWLNEKGNKGWAFTVSDRFGDAGLTGIATMKINGDQAQIVDFILSCRVMGRKIEQTMLHVLSTLAKEKGATRLTATCLATEKNRPCLEFLKKSGLVSDSSEDSFFWSLEKTYPMPESISLSQGETSLG